MQIIPPLDTLRQQALTALATRNLSAVARDSGLDYGALYRFLKQGHEPKYGLIFGLAAYLAQPEGQAAPPEGPAS